MKLAFLDTETTGLSPQKHEILEIALLIEEEGKEPQALHYLIKPERLEDAQPEALKINGYAASPERWKGAPSLKEVGPQLVEALKGAVVVGHNVGFDLSFLEEGLKRSGVAGRLPYHKIDTVTLVYEHLQPLGLKRVSLDKTREFLGWSKEGAHTALKDAKDAQRLYHLLLRANPFLLRLRLKICGLFGAEV